VFSVWSVPHNDMVEVFYMWSAPNNNTEAMISMHGLCREDIRFSVVQESSVLHGMLGRKELVVRVWL
jgi:hypothetical protein